MALDEIVHKYVVSFDVGGGGEDGKVSVIGTLTNNPRPTVDQKGMETLLMVVSIVGMMCFGVAGPCVS